MAATAAPVKYYTYANAGAAAKAGAKPSQAITLGAGESLAYAPGKGYYKKTDGAAPSAYPDNYIQGSAGRGSVYAPKVKIPDLPPGKRPNVGTPPVAPFGPTDPATIDQQATDQAQAGLTPQQNEIRRQQALAAAGAKADEGAITGFQTAAGQILNTIPGTVGAGYQAAAATEGAAGAQVGGQVGADLAAKEAANESFAASQGQQGAEQTNASGLAQTLGYENGVIPADSLAQQGAAQQALAANTVQIPLDAGREQLDARMAQARTDNDGYAQQLIQLAAQFPGLKAQALQQLNQYEIDKANYRQTVRMNTASIASQKAQNALAAKSEAAQEKAAGLTATNNANALTYKWASLNFQSQKEIDKVKASGKVIDVPASKLLGHIVYKDGTQDPTIKVKQTTANTPATKAAYNRAKAVQSARATAASFAISTLGKPVANKTAGQIKGGQGRYVADPSQKYNVPGGVFPPAYPGAPATTNDPSRAERTGGTATSYAQAQQQVYEKIGGASLESRFNLSHAQVMAYVNAALAAAGWKKGK